jgi:hypothetical protein
LLVVLVIATLMDKSFDRRHPDQHQLDLAKHLQFQSLASPWSNTQVQPRPVLCGTLSKHHAAKYRPD